MGSEMCIRDSIGAMEIAVVFLSGIVMLVQSAGAFVDVGGHFFKVKMVLFFLYFIAFVVLRKRVKKARLTNGGPLMVHMAKFVIIMNVLGVMTIVASVLAFHG